MEIELVKQMPPKSSGHNADVAFVLPNEGADAAELNGAWESNSDACEKKSSSYALQVFHAFFKLAPRLL